MLIPSIQRLFIVCAFLVFGTRADYIIDDADPAVQYSSDTELAWTTLDPTSVQYLESANGSRVIVDFKRFNNRTVSFANCLEVSHCQIEIPFHGTGITIHGVLFPGVSNFTASIDGKLNAVPLRYPPIPLISPPLYNTTLYDLQGLPSSPHNLTISIVSWQLGGSQLAFDYAYINKTASDSIPNQTVPPTSQMTVYTGSSTLTSYPVTMS